VVRVGEGIVEVFKEGGPVRRDRVAQVACGEPPSPVGAAQRVPVA
jgi:hypothetical protein